MPHPITRTWRSRPTRKMLMPAQQVGHILSGTHAPPHHADLAKPSHQKNANACTASGTYPFRDTYPRPAPQTLAKPSHQKNYNACTASGTYPLRDTSPTPSRGLGEAVQPEKCLTAKRAAEFPASNARFVECAFAYKIS